MMKKTTQKFITIIAAAIMLLSISLAAYAQSFPHPPHNQNLTGSLNGIIFSSDRCYANSACTISRKYENRDTYCGNCYIATGTKNILVSESHNKCP